MSVRRQLDQIDEQIHLLEQRKARIISEAAPTFDQIPLKSPRRFSNERYFPIFADGSMPLYYQGFTQRPAALKAARLPGRYIWDIRDNVILDGEGNVVKRVGS